jgi:chorismate mutase
LNIRFNIEKIDTALDDSTLPLLIAGPCSAESEEQLMETAVNLAASKRISAFRAGVWKPRTRPNMFEGFGKQALLWLQNVKKTTGLRIATEAATAEHVELALKYNVDILWIGARTSVNPFLVQTIADALRGTNVIVLVKNPVNPDIQLWIGALERINNAGIKRLAAVHRGFSSYEKSMYRNMPMWNIPVELKIICPELPVICDPSHICGNTELIAMVAQKALDMEMDGLMVECHNNPSKALSDASQQLTPEEYNNIINSLVLRSENIADIYENEALELLRSKIDDLDNELIHKLSLRMDAAAKIGEYKRDNNITILQISRWHNIINQRIALGKSLGLNENFLKQLLDLIHQEAIDIQNKIMNINK